VVRRSRLHFRDGRLAASCWTKVHDETEPPMGEIYVISVDPDFQGLGLGKALALAGLDHLASVGMRVGMLYVDSDNQVAVKLYERLGFSVDHVDRAYVGDVPPA
jgi:mycothiol synthase